MKCKVCGHEVDPTTAYCENCGSRIEHEPKPREAGSDEFSWNTRDFPKPKKPQDIQMQWPDFNQASFRTPSYMKPDASEGFVSMTERKKPSADLPSFERPRSRYETSASREEKPAPANAPRPQSLTWDVPQWTMPVQQQVYIPPAYNVQKQPETYPQGYQQEIPPMQVPQYAQPQPVYAPQPVYPVQPVYAPVYPQAPDITLMQMPRYVQPQPVYAPQPDPQSLDMTYVQQPYGMQPFARTAPQPVAVEPQRRFTADDIAADERRYQDFDRWWEQQDLPKAEDLPPAAPVAAVAAAPVIPTSAPAPAPQAQTSAQAAAPEGRRPEDFFTFNAKKEAFQRLLNEEYARYQERHHEAPPAPQSAAPAPAPAPQPEAAAPAPQAQPAADRGRTITGAQLQDEIAVQQRIADAMKADLDDAAKLRSERQKRLEAMAKAREAYFGAMEALAEEEARGAEDEAPAPVSEPVPAAQPEVPAPADPVPAAPEAAAEDLTDTRKIPVDEILRAAENYQPSEAEQPETVPAAPAPSDDAPALAESPAPDGETPFETVTIPAHVEPEAEQPEETRPLFADQYGDAAEQPAETVSSSASLEAWARGEDADPAGGEAAAPQEAPAAEGSAEPAGEELTKTFPAEPAEAGEEPAPEELPSEAPQEEAPDEDAAERKRAELYQNFDRTRQLALAEEIEKEKKRRKHPILRFFGILIVVLVVAAALDFILWNFLPDGPVVDFLEKVNTAVITWFEHLIGMISNMIGRGPAA